MAKKVNTAVAEVKEEEKKVEEMTTEEVLEDEVEETEEEEDDEEEVEPKKSKKKSKKDDGTSKKEKWARRAKTAGKYALAATLGAMATLGGIVLATKPSREEQKLLDEFDDWKVMNGTESESENEETETEE